MNEDDMMNLQQIIHKGNLNLARVWLQGTFLGTDVPDDILMVELTLTKIEISGVVECESSRKALNQVYLVLDEIPETQPEKQKLLARWEALDDQFRCYG